MKDRPRFLITPGDPAGIGPEIVYKTIRTRTDLRRRAELICIGARAPFVKLGAKINEITPSQLRDGTYRSTKGAEITLISAPTRAPKGKLLAGYQSGWSIESATRLVLENAAQAIVTGPISKVRLNSGGYPYSGHTDFIAALCQSDQVTMMLANDQLRISLVTVHIGIHQVPRAITRAKINQTVTQTVDHLSRWWGIRSPRVAIAALNPHAGESGLFGREEIEMIEPEIARLRKLYGRRATLIGPSPADTLFAKNAMASGKERFDAVVCMYHDQGLIPVKLLDFPHTVNLTLGLPIIRTSVDHGTGFDIAGKGLADPSSFQSAVEMALQIAPRRSH